MSADRLLFVLILYICAIQLRGTIGGNPTDRANLSARNASNATNSEKNIGTLPCQEDVLDQCPPNASCDKGKCICLFGFKLNPSYHGKTATPLVPPAVPAVASTTTTNVASSAYCVLDESNNSQTSSAGNGDGSKNSNNPTTGGTATDSGHVGQLPLREPAKAHHILSGVLIPLAFVVILIGSAILVKRTQLWPRLRQRFLAHHNRHRRRPAYEDVVLGNDSDDPPLI